MINSIIMAVKKYDWRKESETEPSVHDFDNWKSVIGQMITIVFILEFILKVIGMGFVLEEGTYLRDGWNKLDFIVVSVG